MDISCAVKRATEPEAKTQPAGRRVAVNVTPEVATMIDSLAAVNTVEFFRWSVPQMTGIDRAHVIRNAEDAIFSDERYFSTLVLCAREMFTHGRIGVASPVLIAHLLANTHVELAPLEREMCCARIVEAGSAADVDALIKIVTTNVQYKNRESLVLAVAMVVHARRGCADMLALVHRAEQWSVIPTQTFDGVSGMETETQQKLVSALFSVMPARELACERNASMWNFLQSVTSRVRTDVKVVVPRGRGLCTKHCARCMHAVDQVDQMCSTDESFVMLLGNGAVHARAIALEWLLPEYASRFHRLGAASMDVVFGSTNEMNFIQLARFAKYIRHCVLAEDLEICAARIPRPKEANTAYRRNVLWDAVLVARAERAVNDLEDARLDLVKAGLYADAVRLIPVSIAATRDPIMFRAKLVEVLGKITRREDDTQHEELCLQLKAMREQQVFDAIRADGEAVRLALGGLTLVGHGAK